MDRHVPVLLQQAVEALVTDPAGCYVDATFGRGGHSRKILEHLQQKGRLIALDRDDAAVAVAKELVQKDRRFEIHKFNFSQLEELMKQQEVQGRVDGLLIDLGVSSPQLDVGERGFSFTTDGPLDMRMDQSSGLTASEWLAKVDESELAIVLKECGEERFARRIARAIVEVRDARPIETTGDLAEIVKLAHPRWEKSKHPATRTFQAIRIHINGELDALGKVLEQARSVVKEGGRLVVISFHSLEDRMVKREISGRAMRPKRVKASRASFRERRLLDNLPQTDTPGKVWNGLGKAVFAADDEVLENPRARSAVMRVAERMSGVSGLGSSAFAAGPNK